MCIAPIVINASPNMCGRVLCMLWGTTTKVQIIIKDIVIEGDARGELLCGRDKCHLMVISHVRREMSNINFMCIRSGRKGTFVQSSALLVNDFLNSDILLKIKIKIGIYNHFFQQTLASER